MLTLFPPDYACLVEFSTLKEIYEGAKRHHHHHHRFYIRFSMLGLQD